MLATLRTRRYSQLLETLAAAVLSAPAANGEVAATTKQQWAANLIELVKRPHRKLIKAADALDDDPPNDDLHALRIRGKRLRYAAELAAPAGGKPVKKLIGATKDLQDLLGDHQDAVIAEQEIRRLLAELDDSPADIGFVAGRLVERQRARRAAIRATWRDALAEVDTQAKALVSSRSAAG
jgi:CHAD domain-containing protein